MLNVLKPNPHDYVTCIFHCSYSFFLSSFSPIGHKNIVVMCGSCKAQERSIEN